MELVAECTDINTTSYVQICVTWC